jgi:hypothetical protein
MDSDKMKETPPPLPPITAIDWHKQYRIIPTKFPPIEIFQGLVPADHMDALFELEGMTNERLRAEANMLAEERAVAVGNSVVMAAFTHFSPSKPSRFSNGSYGVYYASKTVETAVFETVFHRENFLRYTHEEACSIDMRVYVGKVLKPMHDIRSSDYACLYASNDYSLSQSFAKSLREEGALGILYNSMRHKGGECIAAFQPAAVSTPIQGQTFTYVWDGQHIIAVYEKSEVLYRFY